MFHWTSGCIYSFEFSVLGFFGYTRGDPKPQKFIYKKCVFTYSYMCKLQSLSEYSPCDAIYLSRHFFHCSKQFLNSSNLMPFSPSAIFCFTSSTLAKGFPLRTFFIWGHKRSCSEQDWVNGEGGDGGHAIFRSKIADHSTWCGQVCL